ncbi:nicotinamide-nucleotide amidase [Gracilibacillus ureilyticus]|uniref:Putative competence-damage inducible protein n=1 Tax=Gracilibacillus ureilyticus TaxID=531814 RepID=A0A1H9L9T8_9BACI|nr:competence/damage-inducible protein A [Gracilibacillus ureilyticus]SER08232.1 nicotinamide-nucleotide amidase [Gracilibacillus ureilyticus]
MTRQLKAEIISVGTELLLGQISNTNAAWMSEKLADSGIPVYYHSVVGDNLARLTSVFTLAHSRSDIVFVTGGLGPTEDDLTREAFQNMTGLEIKEDQKTIKKMEEYFAKTNRLMTPNNRKQANVFTGSKVFQNSTGIAPGIVVEYDNTIYLFMPGVPREMKSLMREHMLPFLMNKFALSNVIFSKVLRFIGIGESQLEHELQDVISNQTNPTIAPLASDGEVALRISANAPVKEQASRLIDETEAKITARVGQYLYGYDSETIENKVFNLLKDNQLTIASAESLTGGAFASSIVDMEGSSAIFKGAAVVYQADAKTDVLHISEELIRQHGTVSNECAEAMARQVKVLYKSNIGISFTGVAGPGKHEDNDAGTVYISINDHLQRVHQYKMHFSGDRDIIRRRSVKKAFELLYYLLINLK